MVVATNTATSATADTYPYAAKLDKSNHGYCYTTSVTSQLQSCISEAMNYLADSTDIPGVTFHTPCDTQNSNGDGLPAADVAWFSIWIDGAYGEAPCKIKTASDSTVCDQFFGKINSSSINATANPHNQFIKTVCHELGHTAGLAHYNPLIDPFPEVPGAPGQPHDCQASGDVTLIVAKYNPPASWIWTYNQHHIDHINSWW
ncbi:hypothetical protein [Nonomuraea soli]|uniref:Matrixin family metalloprotease n=1 Tax=Nonomuraea soli TaxID=1032476 RepID=A0A7W0CNK4_9ACTN|nr:hypothetical protein [Nonomuraea soli]MBA2894447.1 hypothetical protein [Nonomuraea soli]